jgi:hypothetical protein
MRVTIDEGASNELLNEMLDQASRAIIVTTYISKLIIFIS